MRDSGPRMAGTALADLLPPQHPSSPCPRRSLFGAERQAEPAAPAVNLTLLLQQLAVQQDAAQHVATRAAQQASPRALCDVVTGS